MYVVVILPCLFCHYILCTGQLSFMMGGSYVMDGNSGVAVEGNVVTLEL